MSLLPGFADGCLSLGVSLWPLLMYCVSLFIWEAALSGEGERKRICHTLLLIMSFFEDTAKKALGTFTPGAQGPGAPWTVAISPCRVQAWGGDIL